MKKKAQRAADMVSCAPKTCLYFSIGINIFLAIFVSVLAIYFNTLDKETVENKDVPKPSTNIAQKLLQANVSLVGDLQSSVCFNCDYLGEDVNTNETLYDDIYTTDRQNKLCCLKDTAIQEFIRAVSIYSIKSLSKTKVGYSTFFIFFFSLSLIVNFIFFNIRILNLFNPVVKLLINI